MERKKYTNWDFSKYLLEIKEDSLCTIHTLTLKDSGLGRVSFINVNSRLLVTGDFKNWVFCRCFIPSSEGYVSSNYWVEKATILSEQKCEEFDPKVTKEALKEKLGDYIDESYNMEMEEYLENYDDDDEVIDYLQGCIERVEDGEFDYTRFAYVEMPSRWDYEDVIFCERIKCKLLHVFDAFNEICKRLESEEN
jgi:hypothetical protein